MKTNKGFTLIEVAVVLAIIAILAAILTPIVTAYIDQGRATRAAADVSKISSGILLFKRDTGVWPPYNTYADAVTATTPAVNCLVSGTSTSLGSGFLTGGDSSWTCATVGLLSQYLNIMTGLANVTTAGPAGGSVAFRGPYLDGLAGTDPWANPYIVNSAQLINAPTAYSFAVSAGPDGNLDTSQTLARTGPFAAASDDVASLIR